MTLELNARRPSTLIRVPARSSVAHADVELARHTVAELPEVESTRDTPAARLLARLRRLVVGDPDDLASRS